MHGATRCHSCRLALGRLLCVQSSGRGYLQCDSDNGCIGDMLILQQCCFEFGRCDLQSIDLDELLFAR